MECGDGLSVFVHCDIMFIHIDIVALTLGMPEPHQPLPLQTTVVNHLVEKPLCIIKDSLGFHTYKKQRLLRSDIII